MKTGAEPLIKKWKQQSAMFKDFAADTADEIPAETIKKSKYFRDLAAHLDSCVGELLAAVLPPKSP